MKVKSPTKYQDFKFCTFVFYILLLVILSARALLPCWPGSLHSPFGFVCDSRGLDSLVALSCSLLVPHSRLHSSAVRYTERSAQGLLQPVAALRWAEITRILPAGLYNPRPPGPILTGPLTKTRMSCGFPMDLRSFDTAPARLTCLRDTESSAQGSRGAKRKQQHREAILTNLSARCSFIFIYFNAAAEVLPGAVWTMIPPD